MANGPQLSDTPSIYKILDPAQLESPYQPTILLLQRGVFDIPSSGGSVAVISLLRIGDLTTEIEDSERRRGRVEWEETGSLTFVAGDLKMRSLGNGKMAFLFLPFNRTKKHDNQ